MRGSLAMRASVSDSQRKARRVWAWPLVSGIGWVIQPKRRGSADSAAGWRGWGGACAGAGDRAGFGAFGLDAGEQFAQAGGEAAEAVEQQGAERCCEACGAALHRHAAGGDGFLQTIDEAREAGEEGGFSRVHRSVRA